MDPNQTKGTVEERLNAYHAAPVPQPVEEVKQPEPTPSSNETPTEDIKPVETKAVDEEAAALENSKNPERTKTYIERLKTELAEERAKHTSQPPADVSSVFDTLQPKIDEPVQPANEFNFTPYVPPGVNQFAGLNPSQVQNITSQFVDKEGNVDLAGLNKALSDANQNAVIAIERARQAERQTQVQAQRMAKFEQDQQARDAHQEYPQLDPYKKDRFDPLFFKLVRTELIEDMVKHRGQQTMSLLQAAQAVSRTYQGIRAPEPEPTPQQDEVKAAAVKKARIQGPLETGRGEQRQEISLSDLRVRTRREGLGSSALTERLNNYFHGDKK